MTEWQPIKTSPMSQPVLISWINSTGYRCVGEAWCVIDTPSVSGDLADKMGLNRPKMYWSFDPDGEELLTYSPTHWMPLPEPPK
jgi:hypothetical protein